MNNQVWKTAGLTMALFGAAYAAQAQGAGGQRPNFEEMLAKYDADGDGKLSDAERETMRSEMGQRGQRGQGGQDGQRGQRRRGSDGGTAAMLEKYDTDGSGELSATELAQLMADKESGADAASEGGRPNVGENGQGRQGARQERGNTQRMSREEAMEKYDTDGDGKLSDTEREAMRADMRKSRS